MVSEAMDYANDQVQLCSWDMAAGPAAHRIHSGIWDRSKQGDEASAVVQVDVLPTAVPSPRTLSDDVHLLAGLLGEILRGTDGEGAFDQTETVRNLAKNFRAGDASAGIELDALVRGLEDDEAETLVRAFTNYFQLINLAEDSERIRRIRSREAFGGGPRRGSLREAVRLLSERGVSAERFAQLLADSQIRL